MCAEDELSAKDASFDVAAGELHGFPRFLHDALLVVLGVVLAAVIAALFGVR